MNYIFGCAFLPPSGEKVVQHGTFVSFDFLVRKFCIWLHALIRQLSSHVGAQLAGKTPVGNPLTYFLVLFWGFFSDGQLKEQRNEWYTESYGTGCLEPLKKMTVGVIPRFTCFEFTTFCFVFSNRLSWFKVLEYEMKCDFFCLKNVKGLFIFYVKEWKCFHLQYKLL